MKYFSISHKLFHLAFATTLALCAYPLSAQDIPQTDNPMKIATIGAGNIGGTVGGLFAKAGHEVFFSSRNPTELQSLVERYAPNARAGTVEEAIEFADVILLAVPYHAMPQISEDYADALAGKVILDAGNPIPHRDGDMTGPALEKGTGIATQEFLPGALIVRAFNSINYRVFASEAHRSGDKLAVPLAGDDEQALEIAAQVVRDAGFEPVIVGSLEAGRKFDYGSELFTRNLTAKELRKVSGLDAN